MTAPPSSDRTGQIVSGRYELVGLLGSGGQSSVYRARDLRGGDDCAVKILHESLAADPDFRERMFREARAMTLLSGTAAVRALDQGWTDDGALCLVMELLHGKDLEQLIDDLEASGHQVPPRALVDLLEPVARTLQMAHDHGIIHRDLKPANVFCIDPAHGGGVRLLDFGFAKFTRVRSFTAAGQIPGSPSYLAPESWRGQGATVRSDIYSFSAIIYRALAGRPLFSYADIVDIMRAATREPRPSLHALRPDLPPEIDDWVAQALAIDPEQRFLHMRGCWSALCYALRL